MSTPSLTDFLLARIAEDESVARLATRVGGDEGRWSYDPGFSSDDDVHIARHDPARVLAECEAKRRIVEALVDAELAVAGYDVDDPSNPPSYWQEWGNRHAWREAAELLALPYADHPDYDESWRP